MSNPFISITLHDRPPEQIDVEYLNSGHGFGMMFQKEDLSRYGLDGVRTLIESKPGYGFYVFLIKKTKKFTAALKKKELLQTYEDAQTGNEAFKSYMMSQLGVTGNNYMICVAQDDWSKLPHGEELLSLDLPEALSHISYGVLSGGGKRHKKSYKRKSNKRTKRPRKIRKTRRHKK
jgi:hypothetical protein